MFDKTMSIDGFDPELAAAHWACMLQPMAQRDAYGWQRLACDLPTPCVAAALTRAAHT
jgi:hypothetical protein